MAARSEAVAALHLAAQELSAACRNHLGISDPIVPLTPLNEAAAVDPIRPTFTAMLNQLGDVE